MSDGYTITFFRADPSQLADGMFEAWLEESYPDSVFVRVAYLLFAAQYESKIRKERAEYLNGQGEIVHRREHQVGFSQTLQVVRQSGSKKDPTSGFKCSFFRIDFPEGSNFVDAVYGKNKVLTLNSLAIGADRGNVGDEAINYDVFWHVKKFEDVPRFGEDLDSETEEEDQKDHIVSAIKGMTL